MSIIKQETEENKYTFINNEESRVCIKLVNLLSDKKVSRVVKYEDMLCFVNQIKDLRTHRIVSHILLNSTLIHKYKKFLFEALDYKFDINRAVKNKLPVILNMNGNYFRIYVDKYILTLAKEVEKSLTFIFNSILELDDKEKLKLYLKGGTVLYLIKTSTSLFDSKKISFNDLDFSFNRRLKYSEKNKLHKYFMENKTFEIDNIKLDFKIIVNFNDITSCSMTGNNFRYTLIGMTVNYNNEFIRIDVTDYDNSGTIDYHINNFKLDYSKDIPIINLNETDTKEFYNYIFDKNSKCVLLDKVLKNINKLSDTNQEINEDLIKANFNCLLVRLLKGLHKGVINENVGIFSNEDDDSCPLCFGGDEDLGSFMDEFKKIPNDKFMDTVDKNKKLKELLGKMYISTGCCSNKVCINCMYKMLSKNKKIKCAYCRQTKINCNQDYQEPNSIDLDRINHIWSQTLNNYSDDMFDSTNITNYDYDVNNYLKDDTLFDNKPRINRLTTNYIPHEWSFSHGYYVLVNLSELLIGRI